jgi:hypothetical protein
VRLTKLKFISDKAHSALYCRSAVPTVVSFGVVCILEGMVAYQIYLTFTGLSKGRTVPGAEAPFRDSAPRQRTDVVLPNALGSREVELPALPDFTSKSFIHTPPFHSTPHGFTTKFDWPGNLLWKEATTKFTRSAKRQELMTRMPALKACSRQTSKPCCHVCISSKQQQ